MVKSARRFLLQSTRWSTRKTGLIRCNISRSIVASYGKSGLRNIVCVSTTDNLSVVGMTNSAEQL
ncbi:MAG: hypothetical protein AB8B64_06635 [Granulosicoccus sp.]